MKQTIALHAGKSVPHHNLMMASWGAQSYRSWVERAADAAQAPMPVLSGQQDRATWQRAGLRKSARDMSDGRCDT